METMKAVVLRKHEFEYRKKYIKATFLEFFDNQDSDSSKKFIIISIETSFTSD